MVKRRQRILEHTGKPPNLRGPLLQEHEEEEEEFVKPGVLNMVQATCMPSNARDHLPILRRKTSSIGKVTEEISHDDESNSSMISWLQFHISIDQKVKKLERRQKVHERKVRASLDKIAVQISSRIDTIENVGNEVAIQTMTLQDRIFEATAKIRSLGRVDASFTSAVNFSVIDEATRSSRTLPMSSMKQSREWRVCRYSVIATMWMS